MESKGETFGRSAHGAKFLSVTKAQEGAKIFRWNVFAWGTLAGGSPVPPGTPNSSRQSVRAFSFLSRNRLCAHRESRLLLGNKNSLVLPTSTWIKACRGGSLCPPVFCAAGHTEFEQVVGACLFFHIPVSALAKSCGRRWNAAPTL